MEATILPIGFASVAVGMINDLVSALALDLDLREPAGFCATAGSDTSAAGKGEGHSGATEPASADCGAAAMKGLESTLRFAGEGFT